MRYAGKRKIRPESGKWPLPMVPRKPVEDLWKMDVSELKNYAYILYDNIFRDAKISKEDRNTVLNLIDEIHQFMVWKIGEGYKQGKYPGIRKGSE